MDERLCALMSRKGIAKDAGETGSLRKERRARGEGSVGWASEHWGVSFLFFFSQFTFKHYICICSILYDTILLIHNL